VDKKNYLIAGMVLIVLTIVWFIGGLNWLYIQMVNF